MPSVKNLWTPGGLRWHPDADSVNAPDGVLLRADNMVPDRDGSLTLRQGSEKVYTNMGSGTGNVHTLYTAELENGTTYRIAGVDDTIAIDGTTQVTGVGGSGDLAVADDSYQFFMARGATKKKWDGSELNNWSVAAPTTKPTLAAVTANTKTIAAFNNTENPAVTVQEGSGAIGGEADQGGSANEATKITPDGSTYRGVLQRLWTSDQNYFDIDNIDGTNTDLIDFYIKLENPRDVSSIKVVFGIDDSSTIPFKDNRFEFEFNIKDGIEIPIKDLESESYSAYNAAVLGSISGVTPSEVTGIQSPEQVKNTLANVGAVPSPKSGAPADNVWSHLTVTRGQFKRIGNNAGRTWETVRGFKVVYKTLKGKTSTMTIADAIIIGGGSRALTGTYRCVVRAIRPVKDTAGNVVYYEKSPPSAQSDEINLNHQALQITLPNAMILALDPQADQLWVYLFGGWLDSYYRFAVVPAKPNQGMSIDELTTPAGSDLNTVSERARVPSWGFTYCQLNTSGVPEISPNLSVVVTLRTSELEALTDNERIEPYQINCPDNVMDVAGPWNGRMFVLTTEGYVYPSNINDPSAFNSFQVIDLTRYGDPYWIAKTGSGVIVGMDADIIFLQGDGSNSVDLAQINLYPTPLNIGNPPIDNMHWVDGNSIIYRSNDGLMELTGTSVQPVPLAGTALYWRGQERHDIMLDLDGRFRCTQDNHMLYVQAAEENASNAIWRYSVQHQQWSRLVFEEVTTWGSIFNEPDGTLIAGDQSGNMWILDSGTTEQDDSNDISIEILTPIQDGGNPLVYKDPMDLQIHMDSGDNNATVDIYLDGDSSSPTTYYTASTLIPGVWRQQLDDLGKFIKAQVRMTGLFNTLRIHAINISYRERPQRMVRLDTGYILPQDPQDIVWIQEVEFDANCSEDFVMKVYRNDSLFYTVTQTVGTTGVRDVHRLPVPRQTKGERIRIVFESESDEGEGDVGFDPYMVRVRVRSTGNQDFSRKYQSVYPAGNAP